MTHTPTVVVHNTCKLCLTNFAAPSALQIDPRNPTATSPEAQAAEALMLHVFNEHKSVDQRLQVFAAQYLGVMRLDCFKLRDPAVQKQGDYLRWYVHQFTLLQQITDELLATKTREISDAILQLTEANHFNGDLPPNVQASRAVLLSTIVDIIGATVKEIRDTLQEPKKYPNGPQTVAKMIDDARISTS